MAGKGSGNDNDRYVQPNKERGGWDVVKEDHKQASAHTDTKAEAINRAREIVRNQGGELWIKNEQGQLIDSDTIKPGRESASRDTR
jgi:predicted RNase H-like HicB family nuclease